MRIVHTHQFKKEIKRQQKRGKNLQAIKDVIELLAAGKLLSARHRDHALTGDWSGWLTPSGLPAGSLWLTLQQCTSA
jgi:mRNA interferase YafQ